ncbi:hypothetical protein MHK_009641 [Candidatus Magnetomorum sp. HK-1]|nr:hypothetical protein MHK_009641 [Candidatus Magnetomorum sp. HK-1]
MAALTGVPLAVGLSMIADQKSPSGVFTPEMAFNADFFFDNLAPLCTPKRKNCDELLKTEMSIQSN